MTEEDFKKAIKILSDRDLTKQQQYDKLNKLVVAQGTQFSVSCHIQKKFKIKKKSFTSFLKI